MPQARQSGLEYDLMKKGYSYPRGVRVETDPFHSKERPRTLHFTAVFPLQELVTVKHSGIILTCDSAKLKILETVTK